MQRYLKGILLLSSIWLGGCVTYKGQGPTLESVTPLAFNGVRAIISTWKTLKQIKQD